MITGTKKSDPKCWYTCYLVAEALWVTGRPLEETSLLKLHVPLKLAADGTSFPAGSASVALTGVLLDKTGNWNIVWLGAALMYVIGTLWYVALGSTEKEFD